MERLTASPSPTTRISTLSSVGRARKEHTSFEVLAVSLHVHERIEPYTITDTVRQRDGTGQQMSLFASSEENAPLRQAGEFLRHQHSWTNRLIVADSLWGPACT